MSKKDKDGRYVIDESNVLPDLLEHKTLYLNKLTKQLIELNVYEQYAVTNQNQGLHLIPVKNEKVAKLLFNSNRQEPPKKD